MSHSTVREIISRSPYSPHLISDFYISLQQDKVDTSNIRTHWERDLGIIITDKQWNHSLTQIHRCSINVRHCLMQFKIVHRLHYSKVKLHRLFPSVSPLCEKCETSEATLAHSFILCPKIENYWIDVFNIISKILGFQVKPDPQIIIFNLSENLSGLSLSQQHFVNFCLISAKKCILMLWKGKDVPNVKMWIADVVNSLEMERIRYLRMDQAYRFDIIWKPLILHLQGTSNTD